MTKKRKASSYVSSSVEFRVARGFGRPAASTNLRLTQNYMRKDKAKRFRLDHISGLSFEDQQTLADYTANQSDSDDAADHTAMYSIPPGEEGMFTSNAGGEEELCRSMFEDASNPSKPKRANTRTRHDRTELRNTEWQKHLPVLISAYLAWQASPDTLEAASDSGAELSLLEITTVDFFETRKQIFRRSSTMTTEAVNTTLVRHGYLGTAPTLPSVAVALNVLEAYRQQSRVCPRLSIQAQVRALCFLHSLPYRRTLVDQFSIAYDVYLDILHGIDIRVRAVLKHDTPNWRMLNACAPCTYVLENEPKLKYSMLLSMDGNQSLKLVDEKFRGGIPRLDTRQARSDYWISPDEVNRFAYEAGKSKKNASSAGPSSTSQGDPSGGPNAKSQNAPTHLTFSGANQDSSVDSQDLPVFGDHGDHALEGFEPDSSASIPEDPISICVERWRNAGPESRKKMFALFAISGIFVCVCRHGHIVIMCDMIQSGKLMKYGLAVVNKLVEVYGTDILLAYNIACEFAKTLANSCLGQCAEIARLACVVPAFHGHSHNRGCQVNWLPLYVEGSGKEDFEGCERCFSDSNPLAPVTRLSTPFYRAQKVEQFAEFRSEDKHAESANFIHGNYKQALEIIQNDSATFDIFATQLKITGKDCEQYLREERLYFAQRQREPKEITLKIEYVAAILAAEKAGKEADLAAASAKQIDPFLIVTNPDAQRKKKAEIAKIRTRARTTFTRWETAQARVLLLQDELGIEETWMPDSPEFQEAARELKFRKYCLALDNLERLVIQRLFELTKLGASGLGYKLREKIGKALKTRAEAIKNALQEYNDCATALQRPMLSWQEVIEMVSLAEFELLAETREDIRKLPWAQHSHRQAMNLHFNIVRAREEVMRLNVEIARLFTALIDRHTDYQRAILSLRSSDPDLAYEIQLRWEYNDRISARLAARLYETSQLPGFSGKLEAGKRVGRSTEGTQDIPLPSWATRKSVGIRETSHDLRSVAGVTSEKGKRRERASDDSSDDEDSVRCESEEYVHGIGTLQETECFVDFVDNLGQDAL